MSYRDIITIEPDKRGGRPCIRRMRITVYDGASNSAAITSVGRFQIWELPIITGADYGTPEGKKGLLEVFGRNFRFNDTEIYVDGRKLKKVKS